MKKIAILAVTICCGITAVHARDNAEITAADTMAEAEILLNEVISISTELVEILESVQDKSTADAAAVQLEALALRMDTCRRQLETAATLDHAAGEQLHRQLMASVYSLTPRFQSAVQRIVENDFYGSIELKNIASEL